MGARRGVIRRGLEEFKKIVMETPYKHYPVGDDKKFRDRIPVLVAFIACSHMILQKIRGLMKTNRKGNSLKYLESIGG